MARHTPCAASRAASRLVLLISIGLLTITTIPITPASAQRLPAFLARGAGAGAAAAAAAAAKNSNGGIASLDAPTVDCVDEEATPGSITLEMCAGESGAPYGVTVQWMSVLAFARSNGWLRGDDPRLCRVRLVLPLGRDMCRDVVIGGGEMMEMVEREYQGVVVEKVGGGGGGRKEHQNNNDGDHDKHDDDHNSNNNHNNKPVLPAVLGDESCLDALEPDTYYVFRARARGDREEEEEEKKKEEKEEKGQEDKGEDEKKKRGHDDRPRTGPSLWSDPNAVCATAPEEDEPPVVRGCEERVDTTVGMGRRRF
jgi:hypothetical protein